jgi:DNA-binding Lrp family transcriptional regulator
MYTSFIGIYVGQGQEGRVEKALAAMAEIVELYETKGPFDLLAKVNAGNMKGLETLAAAILRLEGVEKTFSMLATGEKSTGHREPARLTAFLALGVDAGREGDVERALLSAKGVTELYPMMYPYQVLAKAGSESEQGIAKIKEATLSIEGVRSCDEFVATRRVK